jgi:hypothetical protein
MLTCGARAGVSSSTPSCAACHGPSNDARIPYPLIHSPALGAGSVAAAVAIVRPVSRSSIRGLSCRQHSHYSIMPRLYPRSLTARGRRTTAVAAAALASSPSAQVHAQAGARALVVVVSVSLDHAGNQTTPPCRDRAHTDTQRTPRAFLRSMTTHSNVHTELCLQTTHAGAAMNHTTAMRPSHVTACSRS